LHSKVEPASEDLKLNLALLAALFALALVILVRGGICAYLTIRSLNSSATKTWPEESVATSQGSLNCPLPEPGLPHLARKRPREENFSIRLLPASAT
jgi:hypothetical protein